MSEKISVISLFVMWVCFVCTAAYLKGTSAALIISNSSYIYVADSYFERHGMQYGLMFDGVKNATLIRNVINVQ